MSGSDGADELSASGAARSSEDDPSSFEGFTEARMSLEVKLKLVPGSANRQWEAVVTSGGNRDVFRGPLAAVIAALHVTLDEAGSRRPG